MTGFHTFTAPNWEIFVGNLLLLICSLFYLAWWAVCFKPNSSGGTAGPVYIMAAFGTGVAAIALLAAGINALSIDSKGIPVKFVVLAGVALFVVMLLVTTTVFHRLLTSELLIMHMWVVMELSAVVVLYGTGRFGLECAVAMAVLIGIATLIGLICYVLFYRLDAMAMYLDGMVPLVTDALVTAVFLVLLMLSK